VDTQVAVMVVNFQVVCETTEWSAVFFQSIN